MTHSLFVEARGFREDDEPKPVRRACDRLVQQAGILGLSLLLVLGAWLFLRRQTGALSQPLDSASLFATALLLGLWSGSLRWAWCASAPRTHPRLGRSGHLFGVLTAAGVLVFGMALSLPGTPTGTIVLFWGILLGAEAVGGIAFHTRRGERDSRPDTGAQVASTHGASDATGPTNRLDAAGAAQLVESAEEDELLAADELQRMSRVRDPLGGEIVSGLVRCCFDPGERQRDVHLAFCPPLKKVPHFSLEQVDGPLARVRTSLVETFGVGLEVKLSALSNEPTSVQIQFFACEEPMDGELH